MNLSEGEKKLFSVKEAAKFIGVSQVTLHRILKREEIGHFRIGHRILFSMEIHLLPFLQRHENKPKQDTVN